MTTAASTRTALVVSRLLDAVTSGDGVPEDLFHPDAVLDATIPGFRFGQHGPARVAGQLSSWFADPGDFDSLTRVPLPDGGELVRFVLTWEERGQLMAAHQVHVVEVEATASRGCRCGAADAGTRPGRPRSPPRCSGAAACYDDGFWPGSRSRSDSCHTGLSPAVSTLKP